MSVDKHQLQQWVAGAEAKFRKSRKTFRGVPLANRIRTLAEHTRDYVLTERIDLTRATDFRAQEASEDLLVASIQLPLVGKRGVGNDLGMAVASFNYTDREGTEHRVIAVCAYTISGSVRKTRELRQTLVIPMA
jgi:hypothetical protein